MEEWYVIRTGGKQWVPEFHPNRIAAEETAEQHSANYCDEFLVVRAVTRFAHVAEPTVRMEVLD